MSNVRVRIAPSPTGDPHVGTAYVALFNYAFAKRHGGKFILRIEDTDQTRSTKESELAIMRSLGWLDLKWDEGPDIGGEYGPYRQSERREHYQTHCKMLVDKGEAYPCFCTSDRLTRLRETQRAAKKPTGYDGKCRHIDAADAASRIDKDESYTVRLKMPDDGETVLADAIRGEILIPNANSDDQILLKSDGLPTYHLANVVDDHLMKITHVIRAEEWIPSTPKHLRLYQAFGWEPPTFVHLPLLRNNDKQKSKISKRKNPVCLDYYRGIGILPKAMVNFLALMGWSFGEDQEKFSLEQMIERFDLKVGSISLSGPVFDLEKLAWLNGQYLNELTDEAFVDGLMAWQYNRDRLLELAPLIRERLRRYDEFAGLSQYFFSGDLDYGEIVKKLVPKSRSPKEARDMIKLIVEKIDSLGTWEKEQIETCIKSFVEHSEYTTKDVFMTMRLAVTGRKASPPLFETMAALGKERCRRRLRNTIEVIK